MDICLIGTGVMGSCMASELAKHHNVKLYNRNHEKALELAEKIGAKSFSDPLEAIEGAKIIILAVKPLHLEQVSKEIADHLQQEQILVSVIGGVEAAELEKKFGQIPFVSAMPNICCEQGKGVIGLVDSENVTNTIKKAVEEGLKPLGFLHWVKEEHLSALTSLAGCGPAFVFIIIESFVDAGIAMGLPRHLAIQLALETFEGSIAALKESKLSPNELKWKVTSPGGITIKGVAEMERKGVRGGIIQTILSTKH